MLLAMAVAQQVDVLAVTDHDREGAYTEISNIAASQNAPIKLIPGIEFSTRLDTLECHVVGLNFDINHRAILDAQAYQANARRIRNKKIMAKLHRCGLTDIEQDLASDSLGHFGRVDFANYLVEKGVAKNLHAAFKKYLRQGGRAWSRTNWLSVAEVCEILHAANGIAVLAHPLKYRLTHSRLQRALQQFSEYGGDGVEVISGHQVNAETTRLAKLVNSLGLKTSVGSDFHRPGQPWAALGSIRRPEAILPNNSEPVWSRW